MKPARMLLLILVAGLLSVRGIARNGGGQNPAGMNQAFQAEANPTERKRVPVAVELFTSEGCSSCPPADALLARLVKEQPVPGVEIIALGEHVDYWNRLGWRDVYSSAAFSARQGDYARSIGAESVYTPQMVVDGRVEFVGSDERRAREAIATAAQTPKLSIQLTRLENKPAEELDKVHLQIRIERLPAPGVAKDAEILLAVTEDELESNVTSGENAGRLIRHAAVVRKLQSVGKLHGRPNEDFVAEPVVTIPEEWKRQNSHVVILVQEKRSRRVLGAATMTLALQ